MPPSYRINHKAVDAFARERGLEGPLEVRRVRHRVEAWGTHWFHMTSYGGGIPDSWRHVIVIEGRRDAADTARTLAHELGHALDAERITRERGTWGWKDYTQENIHEAAELGLPYKQRRHERDADAFADHWAAALLARAFTVKRLDPPWVDALPRAIPDGLAVPTRKVEL